MNDIRSILITGASSGIGAALAESYARKGVTLAISGRNSRRLEAVARACSKLGATVNARVIDVTGRDDMARWIEAVDVKDPLDLVIANAGISGGGDDQEKIRDIFAVNLAGVLNTILPAISLMRDRGRGQIAIMSSLTGYRGLPSAPAYSASKAAVKAYGEALRGELAAAGIKVSVICPGFVESRITAKNRFPMPLIMTADKAARIIKRGLAANKARISFPRSLASAMWLLSALPPTVADIILRLLPKKE